ncbi:MAG: cell division protein ZapA [Elusimicrobia bacterium]|nr:cell division protein ZapA [Elusimicrobiota bacterium]
MEKLEILGKRYQIQSGLSLTDVGRMHKDIERRLKFFSSEYPNLDKIDILVLYVIELNEKIIDMENKLKKETDRLSKIRIKILSLEEKVKGKIKKP